MRAASLLLAASVAHALPEVAIQKRDRSTNGRSSNVARGLVKRAGTVSTNVYDILTYSTGGAYYANLTVGSPPQDQVVIVDSGSSDLYFDASTSSACESNGPNSCRGGSFNPKNSHTYKVLDPAPAFNTSFGDGSTATGPYASDIIGLGDIYISNVQFGVASDVDSQAGYALGLMGVGYSLNEATQHVYPNMPEVLVDAGEINSRVFSVYLNDGETTSGSILFGGIDTSKYKGDMQIVDTLPGFQPPDTLTEVYQFVTVVTDLSVKVGGSDTTIFSQGATGVRAYGDDTPSLPVLLDTGSSAWSVPQSYYDQIVKQFPYVDPKQGVCDCSHRYSDDTLTLRFENAIDITVPAQDFIIPVYNASTNEALTLANGSPACAFMVSPEGPTGMGFLPAGDAILRSMYVVYDLDEGQMGLAQANVNSTASANIRTVSSGIAHAASSVQTAAPQTYSVAPAANATVSFSVSTASTTIGTATGTAAVPNDAQAGESAVAGAASSSGTGASSTSSHKNAAATTVPVINWATIWVPGVALLMAILGAGIML